MTNPEAPCTPPEGDDFAAWRNYVICRCDQLIKRYREQKESYLRRTNVAQGTALFFTAITPVVLLMVKHREDLLWIPAATTAAATIATGALVAYRWQESFFRCGYTFHLLDSEKQQYYSRSREYAPLDERQAVARFASRIDEIEMAEVGDWRIQMKHPAAAPDKPPP